MSDEGHDFYVYAWLRPCGTPFYIGKGKGKRDEKMKRGRVFKNIVAKILRGGDEPLIVRLHEGLTEAESLELERAEIAKYGRRDFGGILVNLTDGGEGSSGYEHTEESRAKMSAAHRQMPPKAGDFKGVSYVNRNGKWISHIWLDGRLRHIGYFATPEEAGRAYDAKAFSEWGEDCYLNFPNETPASPRKSRSMSEAQRMSPPRKWFKGVCLDKRRDKWRATIRIDGQHRHIGVFATQEEAAFAYDSAALAAWGEACYLNFPANTPGRMS